ncbi:lytic murein transglycosylase [Zobellella taiwanensis]|uniref:Lytic murein transglycosylase n=1 Tax=Zobellella taiwanensis TaxID=347535 RepID=A0A2P7R9L1_9GAMM|nr:lytic murein transglycosylase [Zobellella taiwanensis]PSJ46914.1 lytic murein transglycosylase [Zobellella taiwanensis]
MKPTYLSALVIGAVLSGCAGQAETSQPAAATAPVPAAQPTLGADSYRAFADWRRDFRRRALAEGIRPQVFDLAFRDVTLNQEVMRLDGRQAEFTKPIWEYLDTAASASRVDTGRRQWQRLADTLDAITARYGVDAQVVLAVWGMETNYGSYRGNTSTIEGLATLAYEGRRRSFAETQLLAALRILQSGDTGPEQMRGSWAGAMGHTQFMPTSYLEYAQDFDGDGRRDIWGEDPTDALASTAYYLSRFGWRQGAPWGLEVVLPAGFDYAQADPDRRRPVADWRALGLTTADGRPLPDHGPASLLVPAGAQGPAFVLFDNFRVIRRYNNATAYALGVGHLADKLAGGGEFRAAWPRHERTLSRAEKQELQQRLTALGFDTRGADGVIGPNTMSAIRAFQQSAGLVADGYASESLLKQLR